MKNWLDKMYVAGKCRWNAWKTDESGSHVVEVVIVIGVVVLLALVFKKAVAGIITDIFDSVDGQLETIAEEITTKET